MMLLIDFYGVFEKDNELFLCDAMQCSTQITVLAQMLKFICYNQDLN